MVVSVHWVDRALSTGRLALLGCLLGACSGDITPAGGPGGASPFGPGGNLPGVPGGAPGAGSGPNAGGAGTGSNPGGPPPDTVGNTPGDPRIAQRIWRLSSEQFNAEITRLFGEGAPEVSIPDTAAEHGIVNIAANAVVDLGNLGIFNDGVRAIANWAVDQGGTVSRCGADHGSAACVSTFLAWFPEAAFRRSVTTDEIGELRSVFDDLSADYDWDYAFAGVIRAVLMSPDFLYRTELGTGTALLEPFEIANLLAFAITDHSPDDELLALAENADLTDPDVREEQARRLMASSERSWQRFFWQWLHMETLYSQGDEVGLDPSVVAQMEEEYQTFLREVIVNDRGNFRDVFSAPYTWAQPELAELYGADHPGTGLQRIDLDPAQRGGILTQGAWLVSHGKRGRENVVRRGMNIYKHAMCNDISPPPGVDVQAELAKLVDPDAPVRDIVEARGTAPGCGNCHRVPDPVGMVFESYTSTGEWQDTYPDGMDVDTQVEVAGVGSFDNAPALSAALSDDMSFQRCFVQRYAHYLMGIDLGRPSMVLFTQQAHEQLLAQDGSLEELLVALVRHPAFIERREETGP